MKSFAFAVVVLTVVFALSSSAAAQSKTADVKKYVGKPVQLKLLQNTLSQKLLPAAEIVGVIEACGVEFKLDAANEKALKKVGATPEILTAIKQNPRSDAVDEGVSAGVVNSMALNFAQPAFPAAAKAAKASGSIVVKVVVTTEGKVFSAEAASGNALLRDAAVQAAKKLVFKPVKLSGVPRVFKGVVVYDFKPEN